MRKVYPVIQIVLVVCLLLFFYVTLQQPKESQRPFDQVQAETVSSLSTDVMILQDNISIKRFTKLDPQAYQQVVYYKHSDPMVADELILVQFKDLGQAGEFSDKIQQHIDDQKEIFEGYIPEEAAKLNSSILDIQANYALFVVSDSAKSIDEQFLQSLKEGQS